MSKAMSTVPVLSRTRLCLILATLASLFGLAAANQASAAYTHVFDKEFSTGCNALNIAVDYAHQWIYVICSPGNEVRRFDVEGNPAPFSATKPYLVGNRITYDPAPNARPEFSTALAVDNSNGPTAGRFLVTGGTQQMNGGQIVAFEPNGELAAVKTFDLSNPEFLDVDDSGNIYNFWFGWEKFDSNFSLIEFLYNYPNSAGPWKVDSEESVWARNSGKLVKFEPNAWSNQTALRSASEEEAKEAGVPIPPPTSPYGPNPNVGTSPETFDVDPTNDDVVFSDGTTIRTYSKGDAAESSHEDAPRFGTGATALALDDLGNVYLAGGGVIVKYKRGAQVPDVHTKAIELAKVGHTTAEVEGRVEPPAGGPATECRIAFSTDVSTLEGAAPGSVPAGVSTAPCSPDPGVSQFSSATDVTATMSGLTTGSTYYVRFEAANANGWNVGATRKVVPVAVVNLNTLPATAVTEGGATLNGSFDPDGMATTYYFKYGLGTSYGLKTEELVEPASSGVTPVSIPVSGLPSGKTFHYKIVASNVLGTTEGQDLTFRTASAPEISGTRATHLLAGSATLNARIDPVGFATKYRFEYGVTEDYGQSIPVPDASIGTALQTVSQHIEGLEEGRTYHFRVVAENQWGKTVSPDATFDFEPPACPNAHLRQETHASYLPDCRSYELVSPSDAGSVLLLPSDAVREIVIKGGRQGTIWPVNNGLATNPSRFSYFGGFGTLSGTNPPNFFFDLYMSTRTPNGWVATLPGLKAEEGLFVARTRCSDSLELCIDHNEGEAIFEPSASEFAAELFNASGQHLGTLPSNIDEVPGAEYEAPDVFGDEQISGNGRVYAFTSLKHAFAPGGITTAPGSAYVNDIETGAVELISLLPGSNEPIPQDSGGSNEYIQLPAISKDGSHVLMSVKGADGPLHLYMRVGGGNGETYDVSAGHGVTLLGATGDGNKVDFAATQALTSEDHDTSTDIYQWDYNGGSPTLEVLSQGNGHGDEDGCAPVGFGQNGKCDAVVLSTERGRPYGLLSAPPLDDLLAEGNGDVFFYSPENLDPGHPGVKNQRNLYEVHDGAPRLVATLEPGTQVSRIQISPNGAYVGLLTAASLTGYDAQGKREMYAYDAGSRVMRCASCRPDGLPPQANTGASQSGPFMANDGRVFFSTREELIPQDVDGKITDVYEFVNGRPQLISSGTGSRDKTQASQLLYLLEFPRAATTGLESVSADGNDVFISTYDVLVPQDQNGPFLKFYDARVGGGFPFKPDFAGCEAADECHNEGSQPPAPPVTGTTAPLGNTGNVPATHKKKHHRKKHRKARKQHRKHKHHARAHRPGSGRRG